MAEKTTTKPATKPSTKGKPATKGAATKPVVYPKVQVELYDVANPLTEERVDQLLGWTQEPEDGEKFATEYLLIDEEGKKVRCANNCHNRPLNEGWARTLAQDFLNRRWMFNGEAIIIGQSGEVLSGQHRLIGFKLACQMRRHPTLAPHWDKIWKNADLTFPTVVVFGIEEKTEVVRTLDNVKPRSLSDVLFTSNEFSKYKAAAKKEICKMAEHAIKMLWHRTGADTDAFSPKRTHSESMDFLERHGKLRDCVKHIFEEDSLGKISEYITPGYASALMYLMATSQTDPAAYQAMAKPSEKKLDFSMMEKASEFWVLLGAGDEAFKDIKLTCRDASAEGEYSGYLFVNGEGRGSVDERMAVLIKAWWLWCNGQPITAADLQLTYSVERDDEGNAMAYILSEFPTLGGIDVGESGKDETTTDADANQETTDPTPEEIEQAKKEIIKGK